MKKIIKHYLKNSALVFNILLWALYIYLKFAYFTSKWHFIMPDKLTEANINSEKGLLFAIWHNKLAYSMYIFKNYKNVYGLTSPHSDGKIISNLIALMNYKIIEGSSNKNSSLAVKEIIKQLSNGNKIVITPDGPRGPIYKNNSAITKIAYKYKKNLFPVTCVASKYFQLNSWDQMYIPKPFSKIVVVVGNPLNLSGDDEKDKLLLENILDKLANEAKKIL